MRAVFAGLTARLPSLSSVRRGVSRLARSGWLITATIALVLAWTAVGVTWEDGDTGRAGDLAAHAVGLETVNSGAPRSFAQQDTVVVRDDRIGGVYALHGTLLYARFDVRGEVGSLEFPPAADRPWMRVVAGRVLDVDGIPRGSVPVSMGLDSA